MHVCSVVQWIYYMYIYVYMYTCIYADCSHRQIFVRASCHVGRWVVHFALS